MIYTKKRKKARRKAAPSQTCSICGESAVRLVTASDPRACVECTVWPPDPKDPKPKKKEGKRGQGRRHKRPE